MNGGEAKAVTIDDLRPSLTVLRVREAASGEALPTPEEESPGAMGAHLELMIRGYVVGSWALAEKELRESTTTSVSEQDAAQSTRSLVPSPARVMADAADVFDDLAYFVNALKRDNAGIGAALESIARVVGIGAQHTVRHQRALVDAVMERMTGVRRSAESLGLPVTIDREHFRDANDRLVAELDSLVRRFTEILESYSPGVRELWADPLRRRALSPSELPRRVITGLGNALEKTESLDPIWLELEPPLNRLALLRWETLLTPAVGPRPILRLPYHPIDTTYGAASLNVALFLVSSDAARGDLVDVPSIVGALCESIPPSTPCEVRIFCDASRSVDLSRMLDSVRRAASCTLRVAATAGDDRASEGRDPWTDWVRREFAGRAVDVVHLVGPSSILAGQASIALPVPFAAPAGSSPQFVVRAPHLTSLMNATGASVAVCSALGGPDSGLGWRMLADAIARARPGTVAVHGPGRLRSRSGPIYPEIADVYRFVAQSKLPNKRSSLVLYCHPRRVLPDLATVAADPRRSLPTWVAGTRRVLEQVMSSAVSATEGRDVDAQALRRTFEFVLQVLEHQSSTSASPEERS